MDNKRVNNLKLDGGRNLKSLLLKTGPIWSLAILVIALSITSPHFTKIDNIINVIRQVVITAILGMGVTFVIIGGGIDLSVGSILALCGGLRQS